MLREVLPKEQLTPQNIVCHYDRLQIDLFAVLDQLYHFASSHYSDTISDSINYILNHIEVSTRLKEQIMPQLIWWVIFKEMVPNEGNTIFENYLEENQGLLRETEGDFYHLLTSWQFVSPEFYITRSTANNQRSGTLVNIVGLKQYTIIVCNKNFKPLKHGELVTGFLLPIGNGMYTSPVDLFHISVADTPRVTWEVLLHFHQHIISTNQSPSSDLYLSLMQSALEVIHFSYNT